MLMRLIFVRNILIKNAGSSKTMVAFIEDDRQTHTKKTPASTPAHWMMNLHTMATHTVCIYAYFMMSLTILSWHKVCQILFPKKELFAANYIQRRKRVKDSRIQWVWWQATKVIFLVLCTEPSAVFSLRLNIILEFVWVQCGIKSLFFASFSSSLLEQASKWPLGLIHMVHCVRQSLLYKIILWENKKIRCNSSLLFLSIELRGVICMRPRGHHIRKDVQKKTQFSHWKWTTATTTATMMMLMMMTTTRKNGTSLSITTLQTNNNRSKYSWLIGTQPHWANLFNYVRTVALLFTFFELIATFPLAPLTQQPTHSKQAITMTIGMDEKDMTVIVSYMCSSQYYTAHTQYGFHDLIFLYFPCRICLHLPKMRFSQALINN